MNIPVIPDNPTRRTPPAQHKRPRWQTPLERLFFTLLTIAAIETGWLIGSIL